MPAVRIPPANSIERFGGIGDGDAANAAANDAAFVAAIVAGNSVFIPQNKNFVVSTPPTIDKSDFTVYGEGPSSKITLKAGASGVRNALRFNSSGSSTPPRLTNCAVRFCTIDAQGGDQTWAAGGISGALTAYAVDGWTVDHVRVLNGRDKCFEAVSCTDLVYSKLVADTIYWQGAANPIEVYATDTVPTSDALIEGCTFRVSTSVAIASATASGGTATFTTSTAHKLKSSQVVKVTGCSVNAYNGYWPIASAPTSTTFTVALGSTPANATGGLLKPMADRAIYVGGKNAYRLTAVNNSARLCYSGVSAEVSAPGVYELDISHNRVYDFMQVGVGVTTSVGTLSGHHAKINNNMVVGVDGTTEFGNAGTGSLNGVQLNGEYLSADDNQIINVREGMVLGLNADVDEKFLAARDNRIVLAADSAGSGIKVTKDIASGTGTLKHVTVTGNEIDGGLSATTRNGIRVIGRVQRFGVSDNDIYGLGRSGIICEAGTSASPSRGRVRGNECVDNSNASTGTYFGIKIDSGCDSIRVRANECYDTRGGSATQGYGLRVEATATNVRSTDNDFTGNLTGEVSDATTDGIPIRDYRDPAGLGLANFDVVAAPAINTLAANRITYYRVRSGGGLFTKIGVYVGTVDSGTPGTTDQIAVAVYSNKGKGTSALPYQRKAQSASTTATANSWNEVALTGGAVQVNVGDWLAFVQGSSTGTILGVAATAAGQVKGQNGFQDGSASLPGTLFPTSATSSAGTSARVPTLQGVP